VLIQTKRIQRITLNSLKENWPVSWLNKIIDDQNAVKQELFIIRLNKCEKEEILSKMQKVLLDNEIIKQELFILRQASLNAKKLQQGRLQNHQTVQMLLQMYQFELQTLQVLQKRQNLQRKRN